jgi:D-xylose transport system substrate-binding protein
MKNNSSKLHVCAVSLVVLLSAVLLFGFTSQRPVTKKNVETVKIGFLVHDLIVERWQKDMEYFTSEVEKLGGQAITKIAYGNAQTQISQGKSLIDEGVMVIAVVSVDGKALAELVDYANLKGAKIIAYDRLIKNCNLHYYISFNSVRTGELMAEYMVRQKPKGNYAFVNGPVTDNNAILIKQGQMNVLRPYIDKGDIKIVLNKSVDAWGPLEALMIMDDFLGQYKGTLDVVMSASDGLSEGIVESMSANDQHKNTLLTGQDASLTACKNIMRGYQTMSVYKSIKKIAFAAAQLAVTLAKKEKVTTTAVINNGKIDVPSILFEPVVVDKTNLKDTVVKDGQIKEADL